MSIYVTRDAGHWRGLEERFNLQCVLQEEENLLTTSEIIAFVTYAVLCNLSMWLALPLKICVKNESCVLQNAYGTAKRATNLVPLSCKSSFYPTLPTNQVHIIALC